MVLCPVDPKRSQCFALEPTAEVASSPRNSPSYNCSTIDRGTRCSGQKRDHTLKAAPAAAILVSESGATGETKKAAQRFSAIGC